MKKPIVLCILDGVGIAKPSDSNAYYLANTPTLDRLKEEYPHSQIKASGLDVGLPVNQMGNSEVGHLNLGAGRIVYQSLTRINKAIEDGSFNSNEAINDAMQYALDNNSGLHIMGLLSDGGVHSHIDHIKAVLLLAKHKNVKKVFLHAFLDGRDTLRDEGIKFTKEILDFMSNNEIGQLADISGRYFAMDRDKRFDRNELVYEVLVNHEGESYVDPMAYIEFNYAKETYDEFILPAFDKHVDGQISDNDAIICINFRPDRAIQLASILTNKDYKSGIVNNLNNIFFVSMMEYDQSVKGVIAFPNIEIKNALGIYLAQHGKKQLRIAETEKYAHVTFFFDGLVKYDGTNKPELENSKRVLINSPKVATYDLAPEMSAEKITDALIKELDNDYDVVILNYANGDMVGHTGDIKATIKSLEVVDKCVKRVYDKVEKLGGVMLITADHGNSEKMRADDNEVFTAHSTNPVDLIVTDLSVSVKDGRLSDIAPTILDYVGLDKPAEMTGESLIIKNK
ncbi:2,3-bisphosphoglycerate-independent phosphoglycerate mutase [Mycoplasma sp. P36-A1]|uniref:2,3-bisphosphoglycerate-independent phosphoglycerate mutase n=1 Tax=Mycoplasma sp. P36-A1 TaxID=3252900 RepID=UPI003C2D0217